MPYGTLQRFLMPMFLFGMLLRKKINILVALPYLYKLLFSSAIIFVVCLFFWDGNHTIYVTGFPSIIHIKELLCSGILTFDFSNVPVAVFRLLIGISGSILFFVLFQLMYRENKFFTHLSKIGKYSLGIYILHIYIIYKLLHKLIDFPNINIWIYNLIIAPLIALFALCLCMMIINVIHKNKTIEILLFGASFQRLPQ
jgi:fucose 4-O-acetylase-like acetyltransferase